MGAEGSSVEGDQARAKALLAEAGKKLEAAIDHACVTTECEWIADPKDLVSEPDGREHGADL